MIKKVILFIAGFTCLQATAQTVTTHAGKAGTPAGVVVTTTLANVTFNEPYGITIDGNGKIYITEQVGHRIRLIDPANNNVYTRAGSTGDPGSGLTAGYLMVHQLLLVSTRH